MRALRERIPRSGKGQRPQRSTPSLAEPREAALEKRFFKTGTMKKVMCCSKLSTGESKFSTTYPYNTPPKPWSKGGVIGVVCCKGM